MVNGGAPSTGGKGNFIFCGLNRVKFKWGEKEWQTEAGVEKEQIMSVCFRCV